MVCEEQLAFPLNALLTPGAHAQRWLRYVSLSVSPSVTPFFATTRNETTKQQYLKVQRYTGLILNLAIFV